MVNRDELIAFIRDTIGRDLLVKAEKVDELANGVQILGGEKVEVVTLGVSLNEEFLQEAVARHSNFCIFHHGFDPRVYKGRYSLSSQKRLRLIFQHTMTVMGLHYVLDAHPTLGNNVQIITKLGAKVGEPLYDEWGYVGKFSTPQRVQSLKELCEEMFGRESIMWNQDRNTLPQLVLSRVLESRTIRSFLNLKQKACSSIFPERRANQVFIA